jgi:hypothetical protein
VIRWRRVEAYDTVNVAALVEVTAVGKENGRSVAQVHLQAVSTKYDFRAVRNVEVNEDLRICVLLGHPRRLLQRTHQSRRLVARRDEARAPPVDVSSSLRLRLRLRSSLRRSLGCSLGLRTSGGTRGDCRTAYRCTSTLDAQSEATTASSNHHVETEEARSRAAAAASNL